LHLFAINGIRSLFHRGERVRWSNLYSIHRSILLLGHRLFGFEECAGGHGNGECNNGQCHFNVVFHIRLV
jgi:hypothetical protein